MAKTAKLILLRLLVAAMLANGLARPPRALAAPQAIYDDALAQGWSDWSWAEVDLQAASPAHSGTASIGVTYTGGWQGLYLHHPGLSTAGFTHVRFFLHGGQSGGQQIQLYATYFKGDLDVDGPPVALPPPPAGAWLEVQVPLAELEATGGLLTGLVLQDTSGAAQPAFYLDDISLLNAAESPDGPQLSEAQALPRAVPADGATDFGVRVRVEDPQGLADIAAVTLDASAIRRGSLSLRDDGRSGDGAAGDGIYGTVLSAAPGTPAGEASLLIRAQDRSGHTASAQAGATVVLGPPGGAIHAGLPQRIGWGSNAWSETPGEDWQVNSGVPWDYVYQYITYEWYQDGWGGDFVRRFVSQAWDKGYTPMVVVYMMLATPPACGESPQCYAQKLQNPAAVQAYLAALEEAARQAAGDRPVIFNLEPDFYGFMQQLSNSQGRPAGVQPDDPASYPVALNQSGYPNNLAGFGRYIVDRIHALAPNALAAPMASMWATNSDPHSVTATEAQGMARRTAGFIEAMGGDRADLLVVEWSDRDAGSGLRPWWDDTDQTLPRPSRALLWENALSAAAGKRLMLWQVPVGNMALDNTPGHYRDNRADYLFRHPRDLFDAGVFAVLFGGGAGDMTQVDTDGGFVGEQGAMAYAAPAAPGGLSAGTPVGPTVALRWDESAEPDLWYYRVSYSPVSGGGAAGQAEAGRRNSLNLLLPAAGGWRITVSAYDAMGNASPPSAPVTVMVGEDPVRLFLPVTILTR